MHPADRRSKKKDKSPNAKADEGFYLFFWSVVCGLTHGGRRSEKKRTASYGAHKKRRIR